MNAAPLLRLDGVVAGYGPATVLFDVTFDVARGQVVTLLGRNGMGKSTTIRAIMGLNAPRAGEIHFAGDRIDGAPPFRIAQAGVGYAPEGRQVFPTLSVAENLIATARGPGDWTPDAVFELFPRLADRRRHLGAQLSGGEQQMLAIGRALVTNPKLLILDEATEGLAPLIRKEIWACLAALKRKGQSILLVDKNIAALQSLADFHVVLEKGRVVWRGDRAALAAERATVDQFLHV